MSNEWDFAEDQQRWWEEQRKDYEDMEKAKRELMVHQLREQIEAEYLKQITNDFVPKVAAHCASEARRGFRAGFTLGFVFALTGAILFIFFR
jgi:hypothetical protein